MGPSLIVVTGLIYFYICAEAAWTGRWALSATYFGYAFANIGLYYMAISTPGQQH